MKVIFYRFMAGGGGLTMIKVLLEKLASDFPEDEYIVIYSESSDLAALESLSSAHLEAMEWDRPQIAADLPHARDICGDGAVYASAEDSADWAAKMESFVTDRALRERMAVQGTERMQYFPRTWGDVSRRVRGVLAETVQGCQSK